MTRDISTENIMNILEGDNQLNYKFINVLFVILKVIISLMYTLSYLI